MTDSQQEILQRILECELRLEVRAIERDKKWEAMMAKFEILLPRLAAIFPELPQIPTDEEITNG